MRIFKDSSNTAINSVKYLLIFFLSDKITTWVKKCAWFMWISVTIVLQNTLWKESYIYFILSDFGLWIENMANIMCMQLLNHNSTLMTSGSQSSMNKLIKISSWQWAECVRRAGSHTTTGTWYLEYDAIKDKVVSWKRAN